MSEEKMNRRKPYIEESGRLHLFCLCDGTMVFLQELIDSLRRVGCIDIRHSHQILTDGFPQEKPWMNCLFEASGQLPASLWPGSKIIELETGNYALLNPKTLHNNRYEDSSCCKWLHETYWQSLREDIRKEILKGDKQE